MQPGYLLLEVLPDQAGLVLLSAQAKAPQLDHPDLRFVARFDDIDAAFMHLHECLRRQLQTLEPRTYRVDLLEAMAAADAIGLDHRRIYVDTQHADPQRLNQRIEVLRRRRQRINLILNAVGAAALLLLVVLSGGPI
jgi:hypothetical protein